MNCPNCGITMEDNCVKGTFMWAVAQMKQGKKVRRKLFAEGYYLFKDNQDRIKQSHECEPQSMTYSPHYEATDWEIYEENKFSKETIDFAVFMHDTYEEISKEENWNTQQRCKVDFESLPESNKNVMLRVAEKAIKRAREIKQ